MHAKFTALQMQLFRLHKLLEFKIKQTWRKVEAWEIWVAWICLVLFFSHDFLTLILRRSGLFENWVHSYVWGIALAVLSSLAQSGAWALQTSLTRPSFLCIFENSGKNEKTCGLVWVRARARVQVLQNSGSQMVVFTVKIYKREIATYENPRWKMKESAAI